jgi:hypothetical protein
MRDMEIRGVGNLLGAEQSGQMDAQNACTWVENHGVNLKNQPIIFPKLKIYLYVL